MYGISTLLFFVSLVALPVGLIKPKWVVRRDGVSRKDFGLGALAAIIISLIMMGSNAPSPTPTPVVQGVAVEVSPSLASEVTQLEASPSPLASPAEVVSPKPSPTQAPTPKPTPIKTATPTSNSGLSNDNTYTNSAGNTVHSPAYTNDEGAPAGASAQCGDGTYSFSQSRRGTCSQHGGVARWL